MMDYLVRLSSVEGKHYWVLTYLGEEMCRSPEYKTECKCVVEALFFGTVFGVDVVLPEAPKPVRHLRLVE